MACFRFARLNTTRNTDYVLVPKAKVSLAVEALKEDGWIFT